MYKFLVVLMIWEFCIPLGLFAQVSETQFIEVEQPAEFPGGINKFMKYISNNLKYPKNEKKEGIGGAVYVEFYINVDGFVDQDSIRALSKEEILQRNGFSESTEQVTENKFLRDEAIRVVKASPRWIPGTIKNKPVRQQIVIPMNFVAY
jgi:periplasmic protein TonB